MKKHGRRLSFKNGSGFYHIAYLLLSNDRGFIKGSTCVSNNLEDLGRPDQKIIVAPTGKSWFVTARYWDYEMSLWKDDVGVFPASGCVEVDAYAVIGVSVKGEGSEPDDYEHDSPYIGGNSENMKFLMTYLEALATKESDSPALEIAIQALSDFLNR